MTAATLTPSSRAEVSNPCDRRLRVAFISASYPPRVCGIGDYTALLASALREQSADAEVWTGWAETEAVPGIVQPVVPGWDLAGIWMLAAELVRARPDIVHLQYERGLYEQKPAICLHLPRLLRRAGIPLVTTFHSLDGPRGWGRAHRAALLPLLWGSRSIVVCSQRQLRALNRLPGGIGAKTTLIPVGSTIPVVHRRAMDSERPPGPLRLVYFGFLWQGRNIELLLQALRAVIDNGREAVLEIVGDERDPAYHATLDRQARDMGIADRVRFHGALPAIEVSRILASADLVLLPFETGVSTGRSTLAAALAHAAPVITLAVPDNLSPLFADRENMRFTPVGEPDAFITTVREAAADPALRTRLSIGASRLAESFTWPNIARQTLDLPAYREAARSR